jgi:single-stranded DNA-specific DHH superfamily exonuclease
MSGWRWRDHALDPVPDDLARWLARLPAPALLGRLLLVRGVREVETARRFLQPSLARDLASPTQLDGLEEAATAVRDAALRGAVLSVVAEPTAAGLLAGAAFVDGAARLGVAARLELDRGAHGLSLALDDGRRIGCGTAPPEAGIALRPADGASLGDLGTAGLVLYLLVAVRAMAREAGSGGPDLRPVLDLVALSTLLEGVPLQGANRVLVRRGLQAMASAGRPGLAAMLDAAMARPPTTARLLARLAPRLQAAAQALQAARVVELLTTSDVAAVARLAAELEVVAAGAGATGSNGGPCGEETVDVDVELSLAEVTPAALAALDLLEPHGPGNPDVVLLARGARLDGLRLLGGPDRPQCVLRLRQDGRTARATAASALGARAVQGVSYDVVYRARCGQDRAEIEVLALEPHAVPKDGEVAESIGESTVS